MENGFGAPAVYEPLFDIENRLVTGHLFPIRDAFASGIRTQLDMVVRPTTGSDVFDWIARQLEGRMLSFDSYGGMRGHAHAQGLTQAGKILVQEAMRRGMVVDVDHMSDLSADDTLAIAERIHDPVVSSHTGFRELAFGSWKLDGNGQWVPNGDLTFNLANIPRLGVENMELMAKERDRSLSHLGRIRALGGMVGVGAGAAILPVSWPVGSPLPQNCDGSTTVFAQALRYANEKMGWHGVAMGTDINGFNGMTNPRFGPYACFAASTDPIRATQIRAQADAQQHPVRYRSSGSGLNPMGIRTVSETRFLAKNGAYADYEESVTWEAIARFKAGAGDAGWGPAAVSSIWDGHDFNRDVVRMAYGFFLASNGSPRGTCGRCGFGDTHPDIDSAWDVWHGAAPRSDYAGVKTAFDAWRKLETTGAGEPLEKSVAGNADFDINVDGFAHYGLLPDFLQDAKNLGLAPADLAPLFHSAEDYVVMWEAIEANEAVARAMPDL
jgi:microsomal dipeptidase-like Zn-dependent dipeptidase